MIAPLFVLATASLKVTIVASEIGLNKAKHLASIGNEANLRREASQIGWRTVPQGDVLVVVDPETEGGRALDALGAIGTFHSADGFTPILSKSLAEKDRMRMHRVAAPWANFKKNPPGECAFVLRASVSGTVELNGKSMRFKWFIPDTAESPDLPVRQPSLDKPSDSRLGEPPKQAPVPLSDSISCIFSSTIPLEEQPDVAIRAIKAVKERHTEALEKFQNTKNEILRQILRQSGVLGNWDGNSPISLSALSATARESILGSMNLTGDASWSGARIVGSKVNLLIGSRVRMPDGRVHDSLTSLNGPRWSP